MPFTSGVEDGAMDTLPPPPTAQGATRPGSTAPAAAAGAVVLLWPDRRATGSGAPWTSAAAGQGAAAEPGSADRPAVPLAGTLWR